MLSEAAKRDLEAAIRKREETHRMAEAKQSFCPLSILKFFTKSKAPRLV
jgi:hypothetical protein